MREKTWAETIEDAKERGGFSLLERLAAESWYGCACRDLPEELRVSAGSDFLRPGARNIPGEPKDSILVDLGVDFHLAVRGNRFQEAAYVDRKIRERISDLWASRDEGAE